MADEGLRAQIEVMVSAEAGAAGGGGEQLGLELFDGFDSPVEVLRADTSALPERRGPGRPPGSPNRKNLDLVRLIRETKRPTLLAIKEIADTSPSDLARMLRCSRLEAFDRWKWAAELMAAYEEGRPIARVDLTSGGERLPTVVFVDQAVDPALAMGNPPIEGEARAVVDFTQVLPPPGDDVSPEKSHDGPETLFDQ